MKVLQWHIKDRERYAKWVFGFFILLMAYRWHSGAFVSFIFKQPMKGPELDHSFWLSLYAGFPHFIVHHYAACLFVDIAVIVLSIACLLNPKRRSWYCSFLLVFFFVQRITLEIFSCSHSKSITCVFIALLPFCFKKEKTIDLLIETGRYFLLFVMICSAYFKLVNGELLHATNFATVLVNQHTDLAILNPHHISYRVASCLIHDPNLAAAAYILLFISQAVFVVGFFTKYFDRLLFVSLIAFAVMTYFVMRIYNYDIVVLGFSLLYFPSQLVKNRQRVG